MSTARKTVIVLVIVFGCCLSSAAPTMSAVEEDSTSAQPVDTTLSISGPVDTVLYTPGHVLDNYSAVDNPQNFEKRLTQQPTVALVKSMIIPGLGQIGNRRYFKAALFFGLDAWFVSSAIKYRQDARDFRVKFESVDGDDAASVALRRDYYSKYQDSRNSRNKYTWFAVITTFVSMFDAYADAHLSGFPVKKGENVTISLQTLRRDETVLAALQIDF